MLLQLPNKVLNTKLDERPVLKHMAVRWEEGNKLFIAALDTKYNIKQFNIEVQKYRAGLTIRHFFVISKIFKQYRLTRDTCIMVSKPMPDWHPFYIYVKTLYWQIGFSLFKKSTDDMLRRCLQYDQSLVPTEMLKWPKKGTHSLLHMKFKKSHFEMAWKMILDNDLCPWINNQTVTDLYMHNDDRGFMRAKHLYFSLYYMMVRNYKLSKKKISEAKAIKRQEDKKQDATL